MQITVTGRHMDVTDAIRDYAEQKVGRASKIIDQDTMSAEVVLRHEKNPKIDRPDVAEVTVFMKGRVVRAEEAASDMYAAIDLAGDKVETQLRKYKSRLLGKRDNGAVRVKTAAGDEQIVDDSQPQTAEKDFVERQPRIVREKLLEMKPMTEDEAMLQIELVDHDFFVYQDADSDQVSVLYRRANGDYGVLRTRS